MTLTPAVLRYQRHFPAVFCAALAALTVLAYLPALGGTAVFDDKMLIFDNRLLLSWQGLYDIWFSMKPDDFFPVSSTVWWVEHHLWGSWPLGYHLVHLGLHIASAILLWRILLALKVPGARLAALLFALHPVNVATAAWLSEQKNSLSLVLYLAAVLLYFRLERRPSAAGYLLATGCYGLALLAKPSLVALPLILLVLAWFQRSRISRADILRLLPWLAMSFAIGLVTMAFQHRGLTLPDPTPMPQRAARAALAVWYYALHTMVPLNLMAIYPRWTSSPADYLALGALVFLLGGLLFFRHRLGNGPLTGALCILLALSPILGLITMSWGVFSFIGDHLAYPAMAAFAAWLAAAIVVGCRKMPNGPRLAGVASVGLVVACMGMSLLRVPEYQSDLVFWTAAVMANPDHPLIEFNYGDTLRELAADQPDARRAQAQSDAAIAALEKATQLGCLQAQNNLAGLLFQRGRVSEAIPHFQQALTYEQSIIEAIPDLQSKMDSTYELAEVHLNLGSAYCVTGQFAEAIPHLNLALSTLLVVVDRSPQPRRVELAKMRLADAHFMLGHAYIDSGQAAQAPSHFREALGFRPDFTDAREMLNKLEAATNPH